MNQQPDKLFRTKLSGYTKAAPTSAWQRINDGLDKKTDRSLWIKIAASVALIAMAGALSVIFLSKEPVQKPIAETQPVPSSNSNEQPQNANEDPNDLEGQSTTPADHIAETKNPAAQKQVKTKQPEHVEKTPVSTAVVALNEIPANTTESPAVSNPSAEEAVVITEVRTPELLAQSVSLTNEESIKLVFSADEVDEYLDKKALAEATSANKKSSTLKKLLQKASELKNNQDPFGDLRQKKDEILALNFKSKEDRQNK